VRLARARLAVRKDANVAARHDLVEERRDDLRVHLSLRRIAAEHVVEAEEALRAARADSEVALATTRVGHARAAAVDDLGRQERPNAHRNLDVGRDSTGGCTRRGGRLSHDS
jgi:hypothetical protein